MIFIEREKYEEEEVLIKSSNQHQYMYYKTETKEQRVCCLTRIMIGYYRRCSLFFFLTQLVVVVTTDAITISEQDDGQHSRTKVLRQLQQLDDSLDQFEHGDNMNMIQKNEEACTPCSTSNAIHDEQHRILTLFPKLRKHIENVMDSSLDNSASTDQIISQMAIMSIGSNSSIITSDVTLGTLFQTTSLIPILLVGSLALALLLILPLAIIEAISISNGAPITCVLGCDRAIILGGNCMEYSPFDPKLLNNTIFEQVNRICPFIKSFFNLRTGEVRTPSNTTDVSARLREVLDVGLSPGMMEYLNNVTIATFVDEITKDENTNPLTLVSIIAIAPILMIQDISNRTNTPIHCILTDCKNRRHLLSKLSKEDQCEIHNVRCQLRQASMIST